MENTLQMSSGQVEVASSEEEGADNPKAKTQGLSLANLFAFAVPATGAHFFYVPMWSILPAVYVKHFGLDLAAVATVVLLIRLFDGITDPTIGYLADRHREANGSRKLWVVGGGIGAIFVCYFLFIPPDNVTASYYLGWSVAYFVMLTISEVPHMAWGNELTADYDQRARVFSARYISVYVGGLVFYAIPLLPIYASNDYTPEVLQHAVIIGAVMTLIGAVWAISYAPEGEITKSTKVDSWKLFSLSLKDNDPFLIYCAATGAMALSYGMWFGLIYFYLDSYLNLTNQIALIFISAKIISMMSTPVWLKLIAVTSKSTTWIIGVVLFCLQLIATFFVGPDTAVWLAPGLIAAAYISFASNDIAALSSLGDIVDYGRLKFHKDRGATYYAVNSLIFKVGLGVGGGIALGCAAYFGFDPQALVQSESGIAGLKLAFVGLPLLLAVIGIGLISRTPINKNRHSSIRKRMAARDAD